MNSEIQPDQIEKCVTGFEWKVFKDFLLSQFLEPNAATRERIDRLGIVAVVKGILVAIYGLTTGVLIAFIALLQFTFQTLGVARTPRLIIMDALWTLESVILAYVFVLSVLSVSAAFRWRKVNATDKIGTSKKGDQLH